MLKIIWYEPEEWTIFIHSSKMSLQAVILHNGNQFASESVGHTVHLKKCYENRDLILNKLGYCHHKWTICGDLLVISMLLGCQSGYTKCQCFFCECDSCNRKQH